MVGLLPKTRNGHRRPLLVLGLLLLLGSRLDAQLTGVEGRYHPLNQLTPPGIPGYFSAAQDPSVVRYYQPVRIELPTTGNVAFYAGPARRAITLSAPATAGVAVGHTYRLRISDMPEYPGIELFPSIEILDRLHPPEGRLYEFPVPVQITAEEIDLALSGQLVTKVIYLEQPQLALPQPLGDPDQPAVAGPAHVVPPFRNALAEADRRGRPMVILRLGGRLPDPHQHDAQFFGSGAKITLPPAGAGKNETPPASPTSSVKRNPGAGTQNSGF